MEEAQNGMEWKIVFHTNYIYSNLGYDKLHSNAIDTAYRYEYVARVSMVISQCIPYC